MKSLVSFPRYEEYKDSGVDWLGEVPKPWTMNRLGGVFTERREKVSDIDFPPLSVTKNGVVPQLENAAKTQDGDNRKKVKIGDFVINSRSDRKGSSGISFLDGSVSLINIVLEPKEVELSFINYLLKSYSFVEEYYRVGRGIVADLWTTRYSEMKGILLAIPTKVEQNLIATYLDQKTAQIDQAIDIKKKQIELLKERQQVVIQQAVTKGLDPSVKMKNSGVEWIGEVPEHWGVKKLKYILKLRNIKAISKNSELKYIGMENIESYTGNLVETDSETEGLANVFFENDILFGKLRPYLSKVHFAKFKGICSAEFLVYKTDLRHQLFYKYLLISHGFISVVDASTYGSKMPRASSDFIGNLEIVLPPEEERKEIEEYISLSFNKLLETILHYKTQIKKLQEYKSSLINSAVTGKIKITPDMIAAEG